MTTNTELSLPLPVTVRLSGEDGNAFTIIGRVSLEMRRAGYRDLVDRFRTEAMAGDYDHLLQTAMRWVEVE